MAATRMEQCPAPTTWPPGWSAEKEAACQARAQAWVAAQPPLSAAERAILRPLLATTPQSP